MKVVCPACEARYRLPEERVRGKLLKIRCKKCGEIFEVRDPNTRRADFRSISDRSKRASGAFQSIETPEEPEQEQSLAAADQGPKPSLGSFSTETIWYYSINGESYGPYRESELTARFRSGRVGDESYVWSEGFEAWRPAAEVDIFIEAMKGETADREEREERKKRRARKNKTISLDAGELRRQLEVEEEAEGQSGQGAATPNDKNEENVMNTLSSDEFGMELEDAFDQMFSGAYPSADVEKKEEEAQEEEPEQAPPASPEKKREKKLSDLKKTLAAQRAKKRKDDSSEKKPKPAKPAAASTAEVSTDEKDGAEVASAKPSTPPAKPSSAKPPARPETAKAADEPDTVEEDATGEDSDEYEKYNDDSIDISELLAGDITGTGFGKATAEHAVVDDSPPEEDESRSNIPLMLIIAILVLGIAFVAAALLGDDEQEVADVPSAEESVATVGEPTERRLTARELRDLRLAESSANESIEEAVKIAEQEAFRAVPDEIRNPEAAARAEAASAAAARRQRTQQNTTARTTGTDDSGRREPTTPGFAQPSLGFGDSRQRGPSREIFAHGLNTFVQQSVFDCQQSHIRREGSLSTSRVTVSFRVMPDGSVSNVSVPAQISATTFANCLRSQARNWRFSSFSGDPATVQRTYIIQ